METRSQMAANGPAVSVRGLEKRFGAFVAVKGISFDVARGRIFGFLGPNGAGKSTTIRMLCGILEPSGGEGTVAGFDVRTQPERIKAHIGYMTQKFSLYEELTVNENIDFYSGIHRVAPAEKAARKKWVLNMAGLVEHQNAKVGTLPGGWKQRLALGCAVIHRPPILLLDEPTSGVDPISRRRFWELIYELADEGVTVFVTTHYMDEAEYCDELVLIYRGEIIASGPPARLKAEYMRETVLEISCERAQDAMELIEGAQGVRQAALFGKGLHVVAEDGEQAAEAIRRILASAGHGNVHIERIPPSLEDVFVSLIEEHDRDSGPAREMRT